MDLNARLGPIYSSKSCIGYVAINSGTQVQVASILSSVFSANSKTPFAPTHMCLLASGSNLELRSMSGTMAQMIGIPLPHKVAGDRVADGVGLCLSTDTTFDPSTWYIQNKAGATVDGVFVVIQE